jgi:thymidylate synthase (FAD)
MRLYLVAQTVMTNGMDAFLRDRALEWSRVGSASDAERVVEAAGRVCYMSFGERQYRTTTEQYVDNLIKQGHDSVFEHATFSILVDRVSRALTHQLVRHRVGFGYSQLSQQYHEESAPEFVEPDGLDRDPELRRRWLELMQQSTRLYQELLAGAAVSTGSSALSPKESRRRQRSSARLVLPAATMTTLVVTGNARAWRHVLRIRGSILGDTEMRQYCVAVYRLLSESAPHLFNDFALAQDALGDYVQYSAIHSPAAS